ncbi:MAG TPA: efflux RND transporter permease subunit [Thermoanaerobaculia bacterium]|nr:efflux RND transporter permease subunit [Thermoanaerobaculia bacterium]
MATESHSRLRRWFAGVQRFRGWVLALALLWGGAGLVAFLGLPRDLFPDLALPTLQLLVQSPGRSPDELELAVAQPIEQALTGLPAVRRVTSTSQAGIVQVVVAFEGDSDPWRSRQLVAEKLALVVPGFPAGTAAPLMTSAAGRLQEIQELVLEGPAADPMRLRDHAVREVVPRLQAVAGVARVELLGGEGRQLQVAISPERMRLAGVSLDQIVEALEGAERDASAGILEIQDKQWYVTVASLAATPEAVRRLPVHTAHGLVALGELAEVREAPELRQGLARFQGFEAVSMRVIKQPGAETLATSRRVRAALPGLEAALPEGMSLALFYDQGELVARSLGGVSRALLLGAAFVALVLVVLLGSWRSTLVVIALLPLATLGAAVPLAALGLGLNAMTLGGLAIAVGLLVDAGVIMVENLAHRLDQAAPAPEDRGAVLARAAAEVAVPIATAVAVILAVFIPLLAVGGVAGRLYAPLAVAVAAAMTLSLVLSFTLVPVLVDRLLPPGSRLAEPRVVAAIKRLYRPLLERALAHGGVAQAIALAVALPALWLGLSLGNEFLPALDEGALMAQTLLPSDASLSAIDEANRRFESELAGVPGVRGSYRRTGRGEVTEDPMPSYLSDVLVVLEPGADPGEVEAELAEIAERMPFVVELTTPMNMRISEGIGGTPADIQVELFHPDLDGLLARLPALQARLAEVPGVASVAPDTGAPLPRWRVIPDDEALRRLDVPRQALTQTVTAALQGIALEPRFAGLQRIERVVRFPSDGRLTPEKLKRLPIVVEEGRIIEVGQVATLVEETMPAMIRRKNGQRRLGLNVRTEGDLGGTAKRIEAALAGAELPPGTTVALAGKIEEARETRRRLLAASAAALTLVVVLLFLALGRAREVLVVLVTLPLALAGGLYALWLAGETWNASSIVGVIGLLGVAVQNSLVLITQTRGLVGTGLPFREALREASLGRVRPKLMTAGAAILGLTPMLLGFGGSELERPLALVMVGGLVTSTLFTLLVLPSVYAWVEPLSSRERRPA